MIELARVRQRKPRRLPWRRVLAEAVFGCSLLLALYVGVVLQFIG